MSNLVQTLMAIKSPYDKFIERPERIQGYSEEEIAQMQRLYNISIHGQFKELLLTMGKCSGAVLSGDEIYIEKITNQPINLVGLMPVKKSGNMMLKVKNLENFFKM